MSNFYTFFIFYREEWELSGHSRSEEKVKIGTEDQKVMEFSVLTLK